MSSLIEELKWRGFIEQVTSEEELEKLLSQEKITCYCGFDPSAPSLHIGNYLAIMLLTHFQRAGHRPIALIGGGTGMIGDPSGKSKERNLLNHELLSANVAAIKKQLSSFIDFEQDRALLLNNADWLEKFSFIDFLRDVGKYFRVGEMLTKESVKNRMQREDGLSYTEFSYMLLQSYDYLHLYDQYGCRLQLGGNDQWGNITAGLDLIRKLRQGTAFALTNPLLTDSQGNKLGKSLDGAIYLDPNKTSPFKFYQFWVRSEDSMVIKYLKLLTFLSKEEIEEYALKLEKEPEKREAHRRLAYEVTKAVHGEQEAQNAIRASEVLYGAEIKDLPPSMLHEIFVDVPSISIPRARLEQGIKLVELLVETGLAKSKGAAGKSISGGGVYINNVRENQPTKVVTPEDMAVEKTIILRSGKKNYALVGIE